MSRSDKPDQDARWMLPSMTSSKIVLLTPSKSRLTSFPKHTSDGPRPETLWSGSELNPSTLEAELAAYGVMRLRTLPS